ncbi:hypothetical protein R70241_04710 [Paraburkholderia saeva]|nr:hypothetical protein R70241_04710 [Paraburkholderia saeva]
MAQLRFPLRTVLIEVIRTVDVRLAIRGRILRRDICAIPKSFPRSFRVVICNGEALRHGDGVRFERRDRFDSTCLKAGRFTVRHDQLWVVEVVVNVVAKDHLITVLRLEDVAVDARLLHQHLDVGQIVDLVLKVEQMLEILFPETKRHLVIPDAVTTHHRRDDVGCRLVLVDLCIGDSAETAETGFHDNLNFREILRGLDRREAFDVSRELFRYTVVRHNAENRITVQIVGAWKLLRMGRDNAHFVRLAHLLSRAEFHDREL